MARGTGLTGSRTQKSLHQDHPSGLAHTQTLTTAAIHLQLQIELGKRDAST